MKSKRMIESFYAFSFVNKISQSNVPIVELANKASNYKKKLAEMFPDDKFLMGPF
jgi:hypothetical protein